MSNLWINIWIRTDQDTESGENAMAKKTQTVRLRCSLDNGRKQWKPGECADLPEDQALELLCMGVAEKVVPTDAKKPASAPPAALLPAAEPAMAQAPAEELPESAEGEGANNG